MTGEIHNWSVVSIQIPTFSRNVKCILYTKLVTDKVGKIIPNYRNLLTPNSDIKTPNKFGVTLETIAHKLQSRNRTLKAGSVWSKKCWLIILFVEWTLLLSELVLRNIQSLRCENTISRNVTESLQISYYQHQDRERRILPFEGSNLITNKQFLTEIPGIHV